MIDEYTPKIGVYDREFLSNKSRSIRNALQYRGLANLEKEYGKYMYTPLAVPPIYATDKEKFVDWYFSVAKAVKKIKPDIAGGGTSMYSHFHSVDSPHSVSDGIWETNIRKDIFKVFPELADQIMQLPFRTIPRFSIWSSSMPINEHRDHTPWLDLPMAFRIMLHDENPRPTLYLREDPMFAQPRNTFLVPRVDDSNTFAWNNLRAVHSSIHFSNQRKILLIFISPSIDPKRYKALLDTSIDRYKDNLFTSRLELSDFVNV